MSTLAAPRRRGGGGGAADLVEPVNGGFSCTLDSTGIGSSAMELGVPD